MKPWRSSTDRDAGKPRHQGHGTDQDDGRERIASARRPGNQRSHLPHRQRA
ncbi:hypothetical protein [Pseudomonas sp. RIT623]|uniref:hypothetical protein n=1 Tax=Pseudomonas sp. RIT623 TaxID=2559075 RepID=UPI001432005A|nr:hypothetical protein [Pseudomonas sp. RIT623]